LDLVDHCVRSLLTPIAMVPAVAMAAAVVDDDET